MSKSYNSRTSAGFTIVELLVVIVIIGILAAITIVAYTGISNRAITSSIQSDLDNASKQLKLFYVDNSAYPLTNNCSIPQSATNICLKASSGNSLTYYPGSLSNPQTFGISGGNSSSTRYNITDSTSPTAISSTCPTGFILVPGSATYGTSDFCVMKYEASQVGVTNVPTSVPSVLPWANISQTTAAVNSQNVSGCTGCHLVTEAEWMTLAQNVLSVASNWSGGSVGSGYIYSGHNDGAPANALAADPSDANGYAGETNTGGNQRRTLTLTNGQVIWDMAGDVGEWTLGQVAGGQPGIAGGGFAWRQWNALTTVGTLQINPYPSGTGITGASGWTNTQGIGSIYSNSDDTGLYTLSRGGYYSNGSSAGILTLTMNNNPSSTGPNFGFRVAR